MISEVGSKQNDSNNDSGTMQTSQKGKEEPTS